MDKARTRAKKQRTEGSPGPVSAGRPGPTVECTHATSLRIMPMGSSANFLQVLNSLVSLLIVKAYDILFGPSSGVLQS